MLNNLLQGNGVSRDVVTFTILVEGDPLPSTVKVYSIDVWKELNHIPKAKIVILDGDPAGETFSVSDEEWFVPGRNIEVQVGYHSEESAIFKGIVTAQSIKVRSNGNSILTVDCRDKAVKMTAGPRSRYFYESKESDIFDEIISRYSGLQADVEPTDYTHKELLQFQSTDWDFVLSRADVNGLFCSVDDGTISIKKPDFSQEPVHLISYGSNLLEIDAEMEAGTQLSGVKGVSWDYSKTEPSEIEGRSVSPVTPGNLSSSDLSEALENDGWRLQNGAKIPSEVLQSWTNAKLMKHELSKVRGRARVEGASSILPGNIVQLEGLGGRFNGKAFVSGIKHTVNDGKWVMDIQFGLSPEWFSEEYEISSMPAEGMLPSVSGLQIGLVTQIEGDPEGDDRVLVRLPMIDTQEQGVWARLATAGAGNSRGVVIRPEIDDEVLVGFIHGDPNHPVILGSLHSSNNPAPITGSDDNHEKGWITRGEIKLLIDDDKPSLLIEMPSGKKISVDDDAGEMLLEDENGNKMLINSDGISLESPGDINIKSNGDINLEGININTRAQAGFKAEGSASAEISSSATTTVKGSIVQIN